MKRLRWWIAVPLGLVILLVAGTLWRRARRESALREVLDRHAAEGFGSSLADLLADAPPVNVEAQRLLYDWLKSHKRSGLSLTYMKDDEALLTRGGLSGKRLAEHEAHGAEPKALLRLLEDPTVRVDVLAGVQATLDGKAPDPSWIPPLAMHAHLLTMQATHWFAVEACVAENPEPALRALDRLHEASSHPASFFESLMGTRRLLIRDHGYLRLQMLGWLPEDDLERWLDEPIDGKQAFAHALRADRLYVMAPRAHALLAGTLAEQEGRDDRAPEGLLADFERIWDRTTTNRWDLALHLETGVAYEQIVLGALPLADLDRIERMQGDAFLGMTPKSLLDTLTTDVTRHAGQRAVRLAACAIRMRESDGAFPADEATFRRRLGSRSALMDQGDWSWRLQYERLGPGRIRIRAHPTGPVPRLLDGHRTPPPFGTWPGVATTGPYLVLGDPGVELRMPP